MECILLLVVTGAALLIVIAQSVEKDKHQPSRMPRPPKLPVVRRQRWNDIVAMTHRHERLSEKLGYPKLDLQERANLMYQFEQELKGSRTEYNRLHKYLKTIHTAHQKIVFSIVPSRGRLQMEQIRFGAGRGRPFILVMTRSQFIIYPESPEMREYHVFSRDQLRWFGHPDARLPPDAEQLWLHFERDERWWVLRIAIDDHDMLRILAALRDFTPALMPPYHRKLHLHYNPVAAQRAEQEITGEWTLHEQRTLYLMPLYIVVFDKDRVEQLLPVESITHVASVPRLDASGGVVRFRVAGEDLAYALDDYEAFAAALAEAAKGSLEEPLEVVERKGKKGKQVAN